jgi:isopentenyl phosphate kinase
MKELYMIKIGGGSITDQSKPRVAKREEISRLLSEIYEAKKERDFDVIIGHGSGSFGHVTAKEYRVNEGLIDSNSKKGAILTMVVASELNFIVIDEAIKLGIPVFPFFPSSFGFANGKKLETGFVEHISYAMDKGFVPLVHGDVVMDAKQGVAIASTEDVLRFISTKMPPTKIVLATDVDGIYDKDPTKYSDAKIIEEVTGSNITDVLSSAGEAHKIDVTGGMKTKISLVYEIVKRVNGTGYIANATKPGVIGGLLRGDNVRCTVIRP